MRRWIACLAMVGWSASAMADEWPQWLGKNRDGHSAETGIVDGWKKGPRQLWQADVGPGYASVAVSEGIVYAMTAKDGEDQLVAYDAASGKERWRTRVGPFYKDSMSYDGPRATPTVVGDKIVAMGGYGGVGVYKKATGERVWAVDVVRTFDGARPKWGFSGSPLVSEGKIYLTTGSQSGKAMVALSVEDGSEVWAQGSAVAGYSSPIRATLAGKDQIVFFTGTGAIGVVPDSGQAIWNYPWKTDYDVNAATPIVLGSNRLFVASGYGVGGAALLIPDSGKASELWFTKRMKNKLATSVVLDGTLYGFNESRLTALDATDGKEAWGEGSYGKGTLIEAEGHLIVVHEDCSVSLVQATPRTHRVVGKTLEPFSEGPCWTAPSLADGVLYVRGAGKLVALEVRKPGPTP